MELLKSTAVVKNGKSLVVPPGVCLLDQGNTLHFKKVARPFATEWHQANMWTAPRKQTREIRTSDNLPTPKSSVEGKMDGRASDLRRRDSGWLLPVRRKGIL